MLLKNFQSKSLHPLNPHLPKRPNQPHNKPTQPLTKYPKPILIIPMLIKVI